jgi:DNA polymerase-1
MNPVARNEFEEVLERLEQKMVQAWDTETTGLLPFKSSRLFSIIISDDEKDFYFNFNAYPHMDPEHLLDRRHMAGLAKLLADPVRLLYMHSAKFDMHMLAAGKMPVKSRVHCTEAIARLIDNDLLNYGLDTLGKKYFGEGKNNEVKEYIKTHNLHTRDSRGIQKKFFKVPLTGLIVPYGCTDGRLTYRLGEYQREYIAARDEKNRSGKLLTTVYKNEMKLTRTLYEMERRGIQIDEKYTRDSWLKQTNRSAAVKSKWVELTGAELVDSAKALVPVYDQFGLKYGRTAKGNPSFTAEILTAKHELNDMLFEFRDCEKMSSSYYKNFIEYQDANGVIHTNFKQGGAKTGRMSATQPALQTLPKGSENSMGKDASQVRRCFVPRPDYCFFMPDYDQMEYRFMLEYASEMGVIAEVLAGMDVHQATAKVLGVTRPEAKTINFMLLYGGGDEKLAANLGCRVWDAKQKKKNYFQKLPGVKHFVQSVIRVARDRKYILNWMGRVSDFPDSNFAYRAPNTLIQGGTADVVKLALNESADLLAGSKSHAVLQVHDELVFEIHKSELHFCPEIVRIMETVYPHKLIGLTCSPEHSWISLADKTKGFPHAI